MEKLIRSTGKKMVGIVNFKNVVEKLQKSLSLGKKSFSRSYSDDLCEEVYQWTPVPEDIKEGHFAVIAGDGKMLKRFAVPLSCLTHPQFIRLLEQAAEEYGFDQGGALTIPCRPSELEKFLAEQWQDDRSPRDGGSWNSCQAMVEKHRL